MLCGQGPAPGGCDHRRTTAASVSDLVPGTGPLAAAVPGAFDAWMLLLRDHGTKSLAEVLQYAIGYARATATRPWSASAQTVETVRELFETEWTSSADVTCPAARLRGPGELFRNPALAATWRRLIAEAEASRQADDRVAQIEAARADLARGLHRRGARPAGGPARPWTPAANGTPAP